MRIAIVHNQVNAAEGPDSVDVLAQAEAVSQALVDLGHEVLRRDCTLDLEAQRRRLAEDRPDLVFNLVESLGGMGQLIALFPCFLDALRLPYTGAPAAAIQQTSNKIEGKARLRAAGLPTPDWFVDRPDGEIVAAARDGGGATGRRGTPGCHEPAKPRSWIIKSVWEHASIGMDADSVIQASAPPELAAAVAARTAQLGGLGFAEEFIVGREFNLSLLARDDGPEVLPPAEILFDGYAAGKPRIVDYRAKWEENSFEYIHTPRRFVTAAADEPLIATLKDLAVACWHLFGLAGYGRVDFRVDHSGHPQILEVNTNPCLSSDAGFAAALGQAGISLTEGVRRIVAAALGRA